MTRVLRPDQQPRKPDGLKELLSLALTGTALVLEPVTGMTVVMARIAALAANRLDATSSRNLFDVTVRLDERVRALEASGLASRRIQGDALTVLVASIAVETSRLFEYAGVDQVMEQWQMSPQQYRRAAEELAMLGIVEADPNGNHASGFARTRLRPSVFVAVAPTLLPGISVADELHAILEATSTDDDAAVQAIDVLRDTGIPLPRFDLYVRACADQQLLRGSGPGDDRWGSFMLLQLTSLGRRVLRGDDPLPTL